MNFKSLVSKIDSLPPLSDSALKIQKIYADGAENVDIIHLVKAIESDALLALNILKMINAPLYGFSKKIASISQAVTLFGTQTIQGLVVNYAILEKLKANIRPYGLSNFQFNDMCHLQSALMLQWFSTVDLRHAQFLASLTLIMESGKLILAQELTKQGYVKNFKIGLIENDNIEEYEHSLFKTTSYYVSGMLFEHWNIEPLYAQMLKGLDFDEDLGSKMQDYIDTLDVIRVAINVKETLTQNSIAQASKIVENLGYDAEHFEHIAYRIRESYMHSKGIL